MSISEMQEVMGRVRIGEDLLAVDAADWVLEAVTEEPVRDFRIRWGTACRNGNAPMPTVDRMVLATLPDKLFTDHRVRQMLLAVKEQRT